MLILEDMEKFTKELKKALEREMRRFDSDPTFFAYLRRRRDASRRYSRGPKT